MRLLLSWVLSALALWLVSRIVSGFYIGGVLSALLAVVVIGFVNATLGLFLKVVTFPLTILTLGVFWFVINAVMIEVASIFVPGFHVRSFAAAFWGGIVLSILNMVLKWAFLPRRTD
jgi:putative membrane protein